MSTAFFDCETDGFLPDLTRVWCGVIKDLETQEVFQYTPDTVHHMLPKLEQYDRVVTHNGIGFDFPALRKVFGWEYKGEKYDTLLVSRFQRPKRKVPPNAGKCSPHSLAAWGYRVGRGKPEHEDWSKFSDAMLHRCTEDVLILELTYSALQAEGRGEGWEQAHRLNFKLFENLQNQEEYGWMVDQPYMAKCLDTLNRWIVRIDHRVGPRLPLVVEIKETKKEGEYGWVKKPFKKDGSYSLSVERWLDDSDLGDGAYRHVGGPFSRINFRPVDLDKNKEVKDFLLDIGWEPAEWNTNNAKQRTSPKLSKDDPFEGISGGLGKLVAKRVQCKARRGIIEGWKATIRPDGRIPSRVTGLATTGRAKHSGIVNVPSPHSNAFFAKWMRSIFIAKPGWVLVGCDSKGNQIRQLAARMGDEDFTRAVLWTDLHSFNQQRSGAPSRSRAKNFFYGFIFGAGDAKIGQVVDGTAADGKALKERYLNELPGLKKLIDDATEEWRRSAKKWFNKRYNRMEYSDGWIRGLDGRPILVESPHMILCYFLQSDEAVMMSAAYNIWHKWMNQRWPYKEMWGTVIWYHDEWQWECHPSIAEEAGALASKAITWAGEYYNIACPHEGDYTIGRSWYDTH
jgi:hypothetical protein